MEEKDTDILIAEPEEEIYEEPIKDNQSFFEEQNTASHNFFETTKGKPEEKNKTIQRETSAFVNYNSNNLNKVYKNYDVVQTYVPKKEGKPKQNKQFETFVEEQHSYSPERETVVLEKVKSKQKFQIKPKAKAWLVSIIIILAMLGGLSIYNAIHINNLNNQISETTTTINNVNGNIKQIEKNIAELTDEDNIFDKAEEMNLSEVSEENRVEVQLNTKNVVEDYESQTNFFDKICNFFRRLFGG